MELRGKEALKLLRKVPARRLNPLIKKDIVEAIKRGLVYLLIENESKDSLRLIEKVEVRSEKKYRN